MQAINHAPTPRVTPQHGTPGATAVSNDASRREARHGIPARPWGAAASVNVSAEARERAAHDASAAHTEPTAPHDSAPAFPNARDVEETAPTEAEYRNAPGELDASEEAEVDELRQRDREVRTHEQAHKSAGGSYAGSVQLQFATGPDGGRYAVEGSVPIDVSPVGGDPEATIQKMSVVRRAALAPAEPSGADRQVAARASQLLAEARSELATTRDDEVGPGSTSGSDEASPGDADRGTRAFSRKA